jgi:hypothetical protein
MMVSPMVSTRRLVPDLDRPGGLDDWVAFVRAAALAGRLRDEVD